MGALLSIFAIVFITVGWTAFMYWKTRGKMWSPLWMSFSFAALGIYLVGAGVSGYELAANTRVATESAVWWQVWTGLAAAGVAVFLGAIGLRVRRLK